jgi:hypothetical protein
VEEYYHPMNHQAELEGMDREDSGMRENITVEVEVVGREPDDVMLTRHQINDGAARHRQTHRELKELAKSRCSKGQTKFSSRDSNYCSSWRRV